MTEDLQFALAPAGLVGRFTDPAGRPRFDSGNDIASYGLLHDQVLELFR
jgi:hypothetical protein